MHQSGIHSNVLPIRAITSPLQYFCTTVLLRNNKQIDRARMRVNPCYRSRSRVAHARAAEVVHGDLRGGVATPMVKRCQRCEGSPEGVPRDENVPILPWHTNLPVLRAAERMICTRACALTLCALLGLLHSPIAIALPKWMRGEFDDIYGIYIYIYCFLVGGERDLNVTRAYLSIQPKSCPSLLSRSKRK